LALNFGDLKPKKKLIQKDVKYFDSADWRGRTPRLHPP